MYKEDNYKHVPYMEIATQINNGICGFNFQNFLQSTFVQM
jgi:hypothetical protein